MNTSWFTIGLAAAALAMAGLSAPVAIAAQGDTSGPASGTTVKPSGATQKQASTQSGTAAGAPGAEGKQGGESGSAPTAPAAKTQSGSHQ